LPKGIDALDPELTVGKLAEILTSSNRPVKTILLDQSKIAGIGNIYASEILWEAGISPSAKFNSEFRIHPPAGEAGNSELKKLADVIKKVLTEAIESGGSTMDDQLYRQVSGRPGGYWSQRRVYGREGEPCPRPACRLKNAVIQKIVIGQRSAYLCLNCQAG
jgi:formamidopyrimidine-DNA glycosylase